jgi:hypothetical protein
MTSLAVYRRWYRLRCQLRDQLRFTPGYERIARLRLDGAGLSGFAFFDISIRGNYL